MFKQRLKDLMSENSLNFNSLAKKTGIPVTTFSNYFNRGSIPSITQLSILADFFSCTIDYLVGREDDFGIIQTELNLTDTERELILNFRKLDANDQNKTLGYVSALSN